MHFSVHHTHDVLKILIQLTELGIFFALRYYLKLLTVYTTSERARTCTHTRKILTQGFQLDVFMHYVIIYIYKTSKLMYMLQNNPYTDMNM